MTLTRLALNAVCGLVAFSSSAAGVVSIAADPLIEPARYFDLEGRTLHFKPSKNGYVVSVSKLRPPGADGEKLGKADFQFIRSWGYRRALPFSFAFGGKKWQEIFVNGAGNLTFGRAEAELYPERNTWPDGTMESMGGSINNRAAAGQELMIAALWAIYAPQDEKTNIYVRQSAKEFVVTWKAERFLWVGEGYRPLGPNVFQVRLTPDGSISLSYQNVSERDGIVGIFPGGFYGKQAGTLSPVRVDVAVAGDTLRFSFERENKKQPRIYRVVLDEGLDTCEIGVEMSDAPRPYLGQNCTGHPGFRVEGNRIELFATAADMQVVMRHGVRWRASLLWEGDPDETSTELRPFPLQSAPAPARLSALHGYREGNIFEIFHYPHVSKHPFPLIRYVYQHAPARDDFAAIFTDFRIDDLHNHQGTQMGFGPPVEGIGEYLAHPHDASRVTGSGKLQAVTGPAFLGPRYEEFIEDGDHHYKNYANAVGWLAHEFGHRWGVGLQFRNPRNGKPEDLANDDGHWTDYLNTPSMYSVWKMFCDKPYVEKSQMEGFVYQERSDGVFWRDVPAWNIASGFSALDLYVMGMIPSDEVPDTFAIAAEDGKNSQEVRGNKVPVRIQDVIAANGVRKPGVNDAQKDFTVGLYLLHESGRAPFPDKLRQAQGIEKSLIEYYRVATGGRMHVTATQ